MMRPYDGRRATHGLGAPLVWLGCLLVCGLVPLDSARAGTYHVETRSLGAADHQLAPRRRGGLFAERLYTQQVSLRAYDLLSSRTGSLNAHLDLRYTTDFALESERRDDSLHATTWNRFDLALSYLDWRPLEGLRLRGGRQWTRGSLGVRDFDGVHFRVTPRLGRSTRAQLVAYGGREVQRDAFVNPDVRDVPGIPRRQRLDLARSERAGPGTPWIAGGSIGLAWARGSSLDFSVRRRWRTTERRSRTGSERLGAAASLHPLDVVTVYANAAYHTLLDDVDTAELDLFVEVPPIDATLGAGLAQRRPWFDSASIFNLFGARPHREARVSYHQRAPAWASTFDWRGWGRLYDGDPRFDGLWGNARTSRRVGTEIGHRSRLHLLDRTWRWRSRVRWETAPTRSRGDHVSADTRLEAPLLFDDLVGFARITYLWLDPTEVTRRSGSAVHYLLGADLPVGGRGTFRVSAELAAGPLQPRHVNLFGVLDLDFWQ